MKLLPVVHILNVTQAETQAQIALDAGAGGVFFIHHGLDGDARTLRLAKATAARYPSHTIGVNLLSMDPATAVREAASCGIRHVWLDNAGIHSQTPSREVQYVVKRMAERARITVWAGVAFKYQRDEPAPDVAVQQALANGFVPVTSGAQTGQSASLDKVQAMARVADGKLALASGVTLENIDAFKPYVSAALVATGISKNAYEFDPDLLAAMVARAARA